jgi:hypothetical protein
VFPRPPPRAGAVATFESTVGLKRAYAGGDLYGLLRAFGIDALG